MKRHLEFVLFITTRLKSVSAQAPVKKLSISHSDDLNERQSVVLDFIKFRTWMILLLGCLFIPTLRANDLVDTLQARLADYNLEKPVINLYVHLDRNTYTPEDTIWFKAYVLTPILNEVLYVRITDRKKNQVLEKQFPMYDVRAHGDLLIPDTLPEGKYYFYAYTDRMISLNPNDVFVQPITVSKNRLNRLEAEASVTNQSIGQNRINKIL